MDGTLLVIFSFLFLQITLAERLDMFSIVSFWNWYGRHLPQKNRGSYPFHLVIPAFLCPSTNLHSKILDSIHEISIRELNYHWTNPIRIRMIRLISINILRFHYQNAMWSNPEQRMLKATPVNPGTYISRYYNIDPTEGS